MKKFIIAALALSFAGIMAPVAADAAPRNGWHGHHRHQHCRIVKKRVHHHGHWVVRTVKVCR